MKVMSIIGILVSAVGLYFGFSLMMAGVTDVEIGMGFITFILFGFTLAESIVGVVHKCGVKHVPAASNASTQAE